VDFVVRRRRRHLVVLAGTNAIDETNGISQNALNVQGWNEMQLPNDLAMAMMKSVAAVEPSGQNNVRPETSMLVHLLAQYHPVYRKRLRSRTTECETQRDGDAGRARRLGRVQVREIEVIGIKIEGEEIASGLRLA
jgi:hypothetical protein